MERTRLVLSEQIGDGDVIVYPVGVRTIKKEANELIRNGVKVIIARGGTYQDLVAMNLGIPIVHMVIGDSDILLALQEAAKQFKKVKLILHEQIPFEPEEYGGLLKIEVKRYRYKTVNDLRDLVESLQKEPDTVIVGSGVVKELSNTTDIDVINIFIHNTTLINAYKQAKRLKHYMQTEIQRSNLLSSILYHINDGVIIVETDGKVCHLNRRGEKLLGVDRKEAEFRKITSIIPDYPLNLYQNLAADETKELILVVNKRSVLLSTSVFLLDEALKQLIITIQDVSQIQSTEHNIRRILAQKGLVANAAFDQIITQNEGFKEVINHARRISEFEGSVLIYGDSGTGKELFAQGIHNHSNRSAGPFVAVNCAALSESLLESELFGYVAGAFTGARKEGKAGLFEMAHKGTIFLDEINSMSLNLQAKILRVIEQKEVMRVGSDYIIPLDVRIVAASNHNLMERVRENGFRQDLYFRINTFEINLPPLRERKGDILYLFRNFLAEYANCSMREIELDGDFIQVLLGHEWRGNVRELKSVALRYHAFGGDNSRGEILQRTVGRSENFVTDDLKIDLKELNKTVEDLVIQSLLEKNMTKTEVAKVLGISRQALFKKLNK